MEVLWIAIGILIGMAVSRILYIFKKSDGTFIIDLSDPLKDDVFRFKFNKNLNALCTKKQIVLNVTIFEDHSPN